MGTAPAQEIKALIFERAKLQYQRSKINDYEFQTEKIRQVLAGIGEQSESPPLPNARSVSDCAGKGRYRIHFLRAGL